MGRSLPPQTRVLMYLLFATGLLPFYLLPIWAGVFAVDYGFDTSQMGFLLSADMAGGTIAAAAARYWVHAVRWRPVMAAAILITCAANLACVLAEDYWPMLSMRLLAGLLAGTMMAFVYAAFAGVANPDREFAIALGAQVALGAAALLVAPALAEVAGRGSSFAFVGIATAGAICFVRASPELNPSVLEDSITHRERLSAPVSIALAAVGLFFVSLTAIWVIMERLASAEGLNVSVVAAVLSGGLMFSFLGAVAPAWTSNLLRRRIQVGTGYLALAVAILTVGNEPGVWLFAGGICLYNFFYSFVIPLQTAWIAESDKSGRNAVLVPVVQGIGVTVGPLYAAWLMSNGDYSAVVYGSLLVLAVSYGCVRAADRAMSAVR